MAGGGDQDEIISNINITPMVDVMLVLLVIFMITANFMKKESININLPQAEKADPNVKQSTRVSITKEGQLYLDDKETDVERLANVLQREAKFRPNMRVTLSADESLPYGNIARLMGLIKKAGINRIALSVKR